METEPQGVSLAVIRWAVQLLDRYGKAAEEPSGGGPMEREAKRPEWRAKVGPWRQEFLALR
jgi:hypothetical protein